MSCVATAFVFYKVIFTVPHPLIPLSACAEVFVLFLVRFCTRPAQDDLDRVRQRGQGRVDITVGSALDIFGGALPYRDVVEWHRRQRAPAAQQCM